MAEVKRGIDPSNIERLYPNLKGLYIPRRGEIIEWGTGRAIVIQSPLDSNEPLVAISLNGGISDPFEVQDHHGMGPYRKIPLEIQEGAIEYYDENFQGRFSRLFQAYPDAKKAWESYIEIEKASIGKNPDSQGL